MYFCAINSQLSAYMVSIVFVKIAVLKQRKDRSASSDFGDPMLHVLRDYVTDDEFLFV